MEVGTDTWQSHGTSVAPVQAGAEEQQSSRQTSARQVRQRMETGAKVEPCLVVGVRKHALPPGKCLQLRTSAGNHRRNPKLPTVIWHLFGRVPILVGSGKSVPCWSAASKKKQNKNKIKTKT